MLLNLIIAGIVGCLLLVLYAMKELFDIMNQRINKLTRVTDLLHDRLLHLEKLIDDQEEVKKNTTKNE
jgi:hypothetical protein